MVDAKLTVLKKRTKPKDPPKRAPIGTRKRPSAAKKRLQETWEPACGKVCKCGMRCAADQTISVCSFIASDGQVERGEEPWHVAIVNRATKQLICSGSILNRKYSLLAKKMKKKSGPGAMLALTLISQISL